MIIKDELVRRVDDFMGSGEIVRADFTITCDGEGDFIGKLFINKLLSIKGEKQPSFKKALMNLVEKIYAETVEETE